MQGLARLVDKRLKLLNGAQLAASQQPKQRSPLRCPALGGSSAGQSSSMAPMGRSFSGGKPSGGLSSSSTTMPSTRRRPSGTLTRAPTDTSAPSGTR